MSTVIQKLLEQILLELRKSNSYQSNYMNVTSVADILGLKVSTIYMMVNSSRIPFKKIPGSSKLIFERQEIMDWINSGQSLKKQKKKAKSEANRIWNETK